MPDSAPADRAGPGRPRLRRRGWRRLRSQAGLAAALLAVLTVCAVASGACALMLTVGNQQALSAAVAAADGTAETDSPDLATLVVLAAADSDVRTDAGTLLPLVRDSLLAAAAPYRATVSTWVVGEQLFLDGKDVRRGYLTEAASVPDNATLVAGGWPARAAAGQPIPSAVPATAARTLGVRVGDHLRLVRDRSGGSAAGGYDLVVSGIFTPAETPVWQRDELEGRGYDPDHVRLPTFGPFVVAPGTLETLRAPIDRVTAVLDPDLRGDAAGIPAFIDRVNALSARLQDAAGPSVGQVVVRHGLGAELETMRATLRVTDALMVTVFLLVLALGATTTALIARVLAVRRSAEGTLLRDRGASTAQMMRGAAAEAPTIAAAAAVLAVPITLAGYRLTVPGPSSWWPDAAGTADLWTFALAVLAGAVLPAVVVVISALPPRPRRGRQSGTGLLIRSGADLMLAAVAVLAYLQLRSHLPTPGAFDAFLAGGPVVCALAAAALFSRVLPLVARLADAAAGRGRGLVLPLAGWHLARGGATHGVFLVVLATAVGTLGTTFLATWATAQDDQAAALVGTELVVSRTGGPGTRAELAELSGGVVSPVADRPVVLGSRTDGVKLLAVDGRLADPLLVSRPPEATTWSQVLAGLAPASAGVPLDVGSGPRAITLTGEQKAGTSPGPKRPVVTATPTLVLADEAGSTITQVGAPVILDGVPHTVALPLRGQPELPEGKWRVVAVDLQLADQISGDPFSWENSSSIQLSLSVDGATSSGGEWSATAGAGTQDVRPDRVTVSGGRVDTSFTFSVLGLSWQDAHLTLLSFPASTQAPVAMTDALAHELGLAVGDRISLAWDTVKLEAVVTRVIPYVPSHPREAALLTDLVSLQRALLSAGRVDSATTAWWVGSPRPGAADAIQAAGQGPVVDRTATAAELTRGPLRAPLRLAWLLAIGAAIGLAVTGSAAQAAAQAQQRGVTMVRVRAIGASRRETIASHLAQHAAVAVLATALGTACGVLLAVLLAPLLVVSPVGEPADPAVTLSWAPGPTAAVVSLILCGALLVAVPASLSMAGRSTVAALRAGEAP